MFLPNEFSLFIIWNFDRRFLQNGCNSLSSSLGILMCWSLSMMTNWWLRKKKRLWKITFEPSVWKFQMQFVFMSSGSSGGQSYF
jgi:hypothetical protein